MGAGNLLDLTRLARVFVSPRKRAKTTLKLLLQSTPESFESKEKIISTEDIAEWDYGIYEGLTTEKIKQSRKEKGLDREREWNIWRDGCEDGEYAVLVFNAFSNPVVLDNLLLSY